jgi:hypothetical protein
MILEEITRIQSLVAKRLPSLDEVQAAAGPPDETTDPIAVLSRAQMLLAKHPFAAQAAFSALVAEGRRFAQTEEGRALREALISSDTLYRARRVWESTTLNMLEEDPRATLPTAFLDVLVRFARSPDAAKLEADLQAVAQGGPGVGPR